MTDLRAKEIFDNFVFAMDDRIDFLQVEADKYGIAVTVTMDSLEKLELLFFKMTENGNEDARESLIISFARYLGEIVRIAFNGKWHLSLDDPKNVYHNSPVIINHTPIQGLEFSPIYAMRALWLRKKHGLLRKAIMTQIQPPDIKIDHLIE